jgi:5-(carboxyamino)imidazole ribonucleotide synthase
MCVRAGENILDMLLAPARIPQPWPRPRAGSRSNGAGAGRGRHLRYRDVPDQDGELLVNEVAPRTHNSGHYTIEACMTDQFEQQLRAITGCPSAPSICSRRRR